MPPIADSILIVLLLTNFFILGTANLRAAIRAVALQGLLLSLLPLFVESHLTLRLVAVVATTAAIKSIVIPGLLLKPLRAVPIRPEVDPYLGSVPPLPLSSL